MKVLLIIPAYNEEKCILKTYNKIIDYNKENNSKYDVIVINDGSKDKTEDILLKNSIPHISLINNLGIGGAVQTGYKYAYKNNYDIAVQFDADGQHDINYVKNIINPIIEGQADLVIGSRFVNKDSSKFKSTKMRRVGIKLISFFTKLVTKEKIYDVTSGFRASNKKIINEFRNNYPLEYPEPVSNVNMVAKGYKIKEVPVKMNEREDGESSIKSWKNVYYMINVILSILIIGIRRDK